MELEVRTGTAGEVVLVKRATTAEEVPRLRHELALARAAAHAGVPVAQPVLDELDGAGPPELGFAWAGSATLQDQIGRPVTEVAALVADTADALARLHDAGITHGRLTADHVVVTPRRQPVLVGLSGAATLPPRRASCAEDPKGPRLEVADDVAALGALLTLVLPDDDGLEPLPPRWGKRRRDWFGYERRALLLLADQAQADDPAARPSPRRLAASIRAALGDRLPSAEPISPVVGFEGSRDALARVVRLAIVALGAILLVVGLAQLAHRRPPPTRAGSLDAPTHTPVRASLHGRACPLVPAPRADVDGDGCAGHVTLDGREATVEHRRFAIGRAGDSAAVGDWDCDGTATAAAYRPTTGEVFVFDRWAAEGRTEVVRHLAIATAGGALVARRSTGGGCDRLQLERPDGSTTDIDAVTTGPR